MITREEYELLKEHREIGYKWLVRNKNKELIAYKTLPKKFSLVWRVDNGSPSPILIGGRADDILNYVTWEDEEPTKIDDLIRDYESHQVIVGEKVNKTELIKEIDNILDDIGVSDYQLGECDENATWTISSLTIRDILSTIEKYSPISVGENVKVVIPSFVADWIEEVKGLKRNFKLEYLFDTSEMPDDVYDWLDERYGDTDILAKAWLDGFVVEKEKLYTVQLKNGYHLCKYEGTGIKWLNMTEFNTADCYKLTQSEIESVDPILMQIAKAVK